MDQHYNSSDRHKLSEALHVPSETVTRLNGSVTIAGGCFISRQATIALVTSQSDLGEEHHRHEAEPAIVVRTRTTNYDEALNFLRQLEI